VPSSLHWQNTEGVAKNYAIAQAVSNQKNKKTTIVVVADQSEAQHTCYEISRFLDYRLPVIIFSDWEILPYDNLSPAEEIVSTRVQYLNKLFDFHGIVVIAISTLLQRLPPKQHILQNHLQLSVGEKVALASLKQRFVAQGYQSVDEVTMHGEFTCKGSIIDIYPNGSKHPFRIDFFDDEIDSIRVFDEQTQHSIEKVDAIHILMAKEYAFDEQAIRQFIHQWRIQFDGDYKQHRPYQRISNGIHFSGIEFYFPLFFEETHTFFDYLDAENSWVIYSTQVTQALNAHWQYIRHQYEQKRHDIVYPILPPERLWLTEQEIHQCLSHLDAIKVLQKENAGATLKTQPVPILAVDHHKTDPLQRLRQCFDTYTGVVVLVVESEARLEVVGHLLQKHHLPTRTLQTLQQSDLTDQYIYLICGPIERSLQLVHPAMMIISEADVFTQHVSQAKKQLKTFSKNAESTDALHHIMEINEQDLVVHIEHGIGRYQGLCSMQLGNEKTEFLMIAYAADEKLYVPVTSLHLLSRYSGANPEMVTLHRLGTDKWSKAKSRAQKKADDVAADLLEITAKRSLSKGQTFSLPEEDYAKFCEAFPFDETPDQLHTIQAVLTDLMQEKPMDRVICGDVGFGKTEIAMRAAFITALNGCQTIILVPTTLLAEQHGENFQDRFSSWPINISVLSRFKTAKEQRELQQALRDGKADIVIGTHKLLQSEVIFKNPGLLIIDEEHRFGVKQKEQIKKLKANINLLAMTATPIPRTLNFALSAIRDFSIIATPPDKRLPVKTFLHEKRHAIMREAIQREVHRGGQIYFVHNNVTTIQAVADELQTLLPQLTLKVAHGQMRERALEQIMAEFHHKKFSLLLCTTIIETGIDIPSANTIIINRADTFGLASLHQLRGRVGRSYHQAYAYLLTPPLETLTKESKKRLEAFVQHDHLGAGLALAMQDLEIRGAGQILGDEQSGQMEQVGLGLYADMLAQAVKTLQQADQEQSSAMTHYCEVDIGAAAYIPEAYMPQVTLRLQFYKQFSRAETNEALDRLVFSIKDRFGALPQPVLTLMQVTKIKLLAQSMGIEKIKASTKSVTLIFCEKNRVNPAKVIQYIQQQPDRYRCITPLKLQMIFSQGQITQRADAVLALLMDIIKE